MAMKLPSYQLTHHPIGSMGEVVSVSWPIMLGLLSGSIMMFVDRLFLTYLSLDALNAAANAGMALTVLLVAPMAVTSIAEVFVGRAHGAGDDKQLGLPVWQMIWLSMGLFPIFYLAAKLLPSLFFYKTGNQELETLYFQQTLFFGPAYTIVPALIGFFTAIGNTYVVLRATLLANVINISLDYALIFGYGPLPALGIQGAALATSLSQVAQALYLLFIFLNRLHRQRFGTQYCRLDWSLMWRQIQLGLPAGVGHVNESLTHLVFFRVMIAAGDQYLTAASVAQSIYNLMTFLAEGLSKGVTAIAANLIGARQFTLVPKVLLSASRLHVAFSLTWLMLCLLFPNIFHHLFLASATSDHLQNAHFLSSLYWALNWITVFFLFDGLCWVFMGALTAAGDTRFVLWVGSLGSWCFYVLPVLFFVSYLGFDADYGWPLIALSSLTSLCLYMWRFYSHSWIQLSLKTHSIP